MYSANTYCRYRHADPRSARRRAAEQHAQRQAPRSTMTSTPTNTATITLTLTAEQYACAGHAVVHTDGRDADVRPGSRCRTRPALPLRRPRQPPSLPALPANGATPTSAPTSGRPHSATGTIAPTTIPTIAPTLPASGAIRHLWRGSRPELHRAAATNFWPAPRRSRPST